MLVKYKRNFQQVLKRYQALWAGQMQDQIIVRIQVRDGQVQRDAFMAHVPDIPEMFADYLAYWQTCANLEDDTLPVISPNFGAGIEAGFFGANVQFGGGTAWSEHLPNLIESPQRVAYDGSNKYVRLMRDCMQYYLAHNNGSVLVGSPNQDCAADVFYMMRGADMFLDVVENEGKLDSLLEIIHDGMVQFRVAMTKIAPRYEGGSFGSWMNWWVPAEMCMVGDDFFCTCAPEIYKRFGFPLHQKLTDTFGCSWYHLHNLGLHLVPELAKIRNLKCLELSEDPNVATRGLEMLRQVKAHTPPEMVVIITVRPEEFLAGLASNALPGNTIYNVCEENYRDIEQWTVDYANKLMQKVYAYRA